jgi:hypothetical protein
VLNSQINTSSLSLLKLDILETDEMSLMKYTVELDQIYLFIIQTM